MDRSVSLSIRFACMVLLAAFACLAVSSMNQKSATWDETHYLGIGAYLLKKHQWDIPSSRLHPPLSFYLNSLPLIFSNTGYSCFEPGPPADYRLGIKRGNCLMDSGNFQGDALLFLARLPMVLTGMVLGYFVFLWSREIHGEQGALLSLFFFCLSPNILAHTRLITPDICLTAFGFISFYYYRGACNTLSNRGFALAGFFLGLALLSKYSALLWIANFLVVTLICALKNPSSQRTRDLTRGLGIAFAVSFFTLLLGYGLHIEEYFYGIHLQRSLISHGETSYLNGETSRTGWWYYYLFAFLIKVPLPMLCLILARGLFFRRIQAESRGDAIFLLVPVLAFFGVFSTLKTVNIGLRYVLPVFPFLMVWVGGLTKMRGRLMSRISSLVVILAATGYGIAGLSIHPHYLAYFNEPAGGPDQGYRRLADSNLDWGQDLKGLKAYMEKEGIRKIKLSYFGTVNPIRYRMDYQAFPGDVIFDARRLCREIRKGDILAISATNLYPIHNSGLGKLESYFREKKPIATIGHSIFVYRSDLTAVLTPEGWTELKD